MICEYHGKKHIDGIFITYDHNKHFKNTSIGK